MEDGTEGSGLADEVGKESAKILPLTGNEVGKDSFGDAGTDGSDLVTARGTGDGLVLRLDGRAAKESLLKAVRNFVHSRKSFLEGNKVALEWVAGVPEDTFVDTIKDTLQKEFKVHVSSSLLWEATPITRSSSSRSESRVSSSGDREALNLFSGIDALEGGHKKFDSDSSSSSSLPDFDKKISRSTSDNRAFGASVWDDPDARVIYSTLRSGQKVETEHTLVVVGDVNSGAELVAGGDIIVLGTLRGVAHAGAYDESGGGRFICALSLQPTQLRIGVVISRGATERVASSPCPEIARVEGNNIVVEPYSPRVVRGRMGV
ncbi:MAG: septum site-determining protein MinC [Bdellovibrionales bacterium]|nr:septum site-determining protein MinC [Bdellovibrionales bacterium]